jgi:formamidopyrimidine-DNA glycosylase
MIEFPEAVTLASQIRKSFRGRRVTKVIAGSSPHRFAWFHGSAQDYPALLEGRTVAGAGSHGGLVKVEYDGVTLLFGDGVSMKRHEPGTKVPERHQLLLGFDDGSIMTASVQMYGGLWAFRNGTFANPYYEVAKEKPSPITSAFSSEYFSDFSATPEASKLSLKALLATEQRIPGLGNGVLQDILWNAGIHPKRKTGTLTPEEREGLFRAIRETLTEMTESGGRDTEKDLFGNPGGYATRMSRSTAGQPCPRCGETIRRESYMGGTVTFCPECQRQSV